MRRGSPALIEDDRIVFLRQRDVMRLTGHTVSTLYRLGRAGLFPRPIPLTERCVGWIENQVLQYNKLKALAASDDEIRAFVDSVALPKQPVRRRQRSPAKRLRA